MKLKTETVITRKIYLDPKPTEQEDTNDDSLGYWDGFGEEAF